MTGAVRTLVVWCPDWPVVAAGSPPTAPAAVFVANRVVACSPAARAAGVRHGMRRRQAQGRCPDLDVLAPDPDAEARAFEPVLAAIETLAPRLEVTAPGACAVPTRGPARYWGGDAALAARAHALVTEVLAGRAACGVGVADGAFAATLAARAAVVPGAGVLGAGVVVVGPGESAAFLAPRPVTALGDADLADVLVRLGVRTLGEVAALGAGDLVGRFGPAGRRAHRLASGLDERPPDLRRPPPELTVAHELDPPATRVDAAAFVARALAAELHARLDRLGLAATRVAIEVETIHGERHARVWRHEGALDEAMLAERARWQIDGWLHSDARGRPTAGISLLRLVPDEVVAATGRQLGFWGGSTRETERAVRVIARVQALWGPEAVTVPAWRGGRTPGAAVVRVAAHTVDLAADRPATRASFVTAPWPGGLPAPRPAVLHDPPLPAEVRDAEGREVGVSGRGEVSAAPARVRLGGGGAANPGIWQEVTAWAGPWPLDERWWDPATRRRSARVQVVLEDGTAHLLERAGGGWRRTATYD